MLCEGPVRFLCQPELTEETGNKISCLYSFRLSSLEVHSQVDEFVDRYKISIADSGRPTGSLQPMFRPGYDAVLELLT
jgi:hypothetical protein